MIARSYNVGSRLQKGLCADNVEPVALSHAGILAVEDGEIYRVVVAKPSESAAYIFNRALAHDVAECEDLYL
jgi:hypothetical protein